MTQKPPVVVSITMVYEANSNTADLQLMARQPARELTARERADRLYALGEFAAAAEMLSQTSAN
jgi:hypothetical protein